MEYFNTWTPAFNRLVNDIFLFAKNSTLCNYADNNTQFSCKKTSDQVLNNLKTDFCTLEILFCHSFLVLNPKNVSSPEVFLGKLVLKICRRITGEQPC